MRHKPIIALGDSITRGHSLPPEKTWPHLLSLALKERLGEKVPEVMNAGGNGHTSREGLARIQADVLDKKPSVVLVEFGGNDAGHNPIDFPDKHVTLEEFERNLRKIHALVTEVGGQTVFMTFTPVIVEWTANKGLHPFFAPHGGVEAFIGTYREATRKAAKELECALFDLELFVQMQIKAHGVEAIMDPDGVHLTPRCNELVAKALVPHALKWLGEK